MDVSHSSFFTSFVVEDSLDSRSNFAFTSDLAKIRPGIDCMLENMPPSLINRAHEVSLALQLSKLLQTCLNFKRPGSSLATRV